MKINRSSWIKAIEFLSTRNQNLASPITCVLSLWFTPHTFTADALCCVVVSNDAITSSEWHTFGVIITIFALHYTTLHYTTQY